MTVRPRSYHCTQLQPHKQKTRATPSPIAISQHTTLCKQQVYRQIYSKQGLHPVQLQFHNAQHTTLCQQRVHRQIHSKQGLHPVQTIMSKRKQIYSKQGLHTVQFANFTMHNTRATATPSAILFFK